MNNKIDDALFDKHKWHFRLFATAMLTSGGCEFIFLVIVNNFFAEFLCLVMLFVFDALYRAFSYIISHNKQFPIGGV